MDRKSEYAAKLRDPRWQKKRLTILSRDNWQCQLCGDSHATLHVHHRYYEKDAEPWDYPDTALETLCETCHESETEYRHCEEQGLLRSVRAAGFHIGDFASLNCAITFHKFNYPPDVVSSILEWALQNQEMCDLISERYFVALPHRPRTTYSSPETETESN